MANFSTFVILPMSFLCGTFFSPDRLPKAVSYIIEVLPLTHASYVLHALAWGGEVLPISLAVLAGYAVVSYVTSVNSGKEGR